MAITWLVRFGDVEKNFATKAAAIQYLRRRTNDYRPFLALQRRERGSYRYFGPGEDQWVPKSDIDRLDFPPPRFYRRRPRQQKLTAVQTTTVQERSS